MDRAPVGPAGALNPGPSRGAGLRPSSPGPPLPFPRLAGIGQSFATGAFLSLPGFVVAGLVSGIPVGEAAGGRPHAGGYTTPALEPEAEYAIRGSAPEPGLAPHRRDPTLLPRRLEPGAPEVFTSGRARFTISVETERIPHRVVGLVVLPGERIELEVEEEGEFVLAHAAGEVIATGTRRWTWTAPSSPGVAALRIESETHSDTIYLNTFVAYPRAAVRREALNGYRIGRYLERPLRGDPAYLPPEGFIEVRAEDEDLLVSPHFTIGQFLCKQPGNPRYLALSLPLLLKLESILESVNRKGHPARTLHVMSGFRTPAYNRAIGNTTDYSRHLWGDAADIFIDEDGDGTMDDLNRDGRADQLDARVLARIVEGLMQDPPEDLRPGGLAVYPANSAHGPFVHVDARGSRARW